MKSNTNRYRKRVPYNKSDATKKIVKKAVRQELAKEIEVKNFFGRTPLSTSFNVQNSGFVQSVLYDANTPGWMTQGIARNQYLGDTITPHRVRVNYVCYGVIPANTAYTFRVLLVQVKGGGTVAPVNVLQSVGNFLTPWSYKDPSYEDTFRILYSKMHTIDNVGQQIAKGSIDIGRKQLRQINMLGNSATAVTANNIFIVVYTDSLTVNPYFSMQHCISYTDA